MYYNSFLSLISQLRFQKEGKISLNGCEIHIKSFPEKERWELSTELFHPSDLPCHLRESFGMTGRLHLNSQNTHLQRNENGISLVQTIPSPKKFIEYKAQLERFFESLELWVDV